MIFARCNKRRNSIGRSSEMKKVLRVLPADLKLASIYSIYCGAADRVAIISLTHSPLRIAAQRRITRFRRTGADISRETPLLTGKFETRTATPCNPIPFAKQPAKNRATINSTKIPLGRNVVFATCTAKVALCTRYVCSTSKSVEKWRWSHQVPTAIRLRHRMQKRRTER